MELNLRSKKCENVVSLTSLYDTLTRGSLRKAADKFINLEVFQVTILHFFTIFDGNNHIFTIFDENNLLVRM